MNSASTAAIEQVLGQMRALARTAGTPPELAAAMSPGTSVPGGFAGELARSLQKVSAVQEASNAQARAFQAGEPGVNLNDVMIDMQKASVSFQMTLQLRNRLVAAYQEIASMPV